ncbi:superoxide dismutase [Alkalihalophilus marmarensis]|jgi:Fe-Mn family superoxide dismutase|uniref:superoxide dismutase n=1 Tax=Alkalihalophilus marmarensis DSM 21297 TaxID=1188261 RepID=U6SV84_9BACI|nr:superoxide dismutase [Alkalihalophilus marmarensis]ERN54561.1 superoxide dismutase [Alkalihalophilus marmarensis DSM 21297]MCM3490476.1 superoxide dismutase [Alkalihalophilus marmarensis]
MGYNDQLYEWAEDIKQLWNEQGEFIESQVGKQKTVAFVSSLTSLLNSMEEQQLRDSADYENEAWEVYDAWHKMFSDNRNDGGVRAVPIGGHTLPPLPYAYNALEPYIAEEIMRLHHDKHHQSYVDGLNKAENAMQGARETGDFSLIKHWEREAAFHGSGHYLHSIFWEIMNPDGGGEPSGELLEQINQDFGSFEQMKKHFSEAANAVEGGGWAILVWSPRSHRLEILQAEKHQNLSQQDQIPLLVLDVWEHAYYLQYKNERKPYIENWWNIVNWPAVEERYATAKQVRWQPY